MYSINVNDIIRECGTDKSLLAFLRDDLHLTAAKDGCSEGACGTCTALVDGKKTKACVAELSKLAGKKVVTVEGIPAGEMAVCKYCFAEAGADMPAVAETTVLLTDIAEFADMNEAYAGFSSAPYPARAAFQVVALPKGAKVEIKAVACI